MTSLQHGSATTTKPFDIRDYLDGRAVFHAGTANSIMQLSWPQIGYGVYESTVADGDVRKVPLKRLRTTVTYLAVALLGSEEERAAYRDAVNGQHRQVRSTSDSPVAYNAFSRRLQLWVAACLYYGSVDFHERLHGPIPEEHRDAHYRYCARLGTSLQLRDEDWPESRDAFDRYWKEGLEQVSVDATIRRYFLDLLDLTFLPRWQRRNAARSRFVNTGFLPPEFRDALGLPWTTADQQRFDRFVARAGSRARREPRALRNALFTLALWDFRLRRFLKRPLV